MMKLPKGVSRTCSMRAGKSKKNQYECIESAYLNRVRMIAVATALPSIETATEM
jgi:hypothetical protein